MEDDEDEDSSRSRSSQHDSDDSIECSDSERPSAWSSRSPTSPLRSPPLSKEHELRQQQQAKAEEDEKEALLYPNPFRWDRGHPLDRALTAHPFHRFHSSSLPSSPFHLPRATVLGSVQAEWFASSCVVSSRSTHRHDSPVLSGRFPFITSLTLLLPLSAISSGRGSSPLSRATCPGCRSRLAPCFPRERHCRARSPCSHLIFPLPLLCCRPYVSGCRFDRVGALLAVSSSHGRLQVFDADVAHTHTVASSKAGRLNSLTPLRDFTVARSAAGSRLRPALPARSCSFSPAPLAVLLGIEWTCSSGIRCTRISWQWPAPPTLTCTCQPLTRHTTTAPTAKQPSSAPPSSSPLPPGSLPSLPAATT